MLTGPIFSREALTAPRQMKHFLLRSGYVGALFVLMYTIQQATIGFQDIRNAGDISRFGNLVFQVFALVQLALVMFFALLFAAGTVSQEKDRQTLILLMMTEISNEMNGSPDYPSCSIYYSAPATLILVSTLAKTL